MLQGAKMRLRKLFSALLLSVVWSGSSTAEMVALDQNVSAYVSGPTEASAAIVLVHDYFGISSATKSEADRLAGLGYRVVAVDLYKGATATKGADAEKLMNALNQDEAQGAVSLAIKSLGERKVGILAFSMGGKIGLEASLRHADKVTAAAAVYGGSYETLDTVRLKSVDQVLLITGSNDEWSYPSLLALQERMAKSGKFVSSYVHAGAGHGFAQPMFMDGKNFDETAIAATRAVLDQFFQRTLSPKP
jgi:carboxymethylenebutenolidase